jgi:hypothetical protein
MRDIIGGDMMFHHDSESKLDSQPACRRSMGTGFSEATVEKEETVVIWRLMTTTCSRLGQIRRAKTFSRRVWFTI